ncbi:MAG: hypothetical protein RBS99_15475 [Rhodospirillales bacterium]|jgi:integrase|nr:hypothetical protein [Rhodospirillales bacterium]
MINDAFHPIDDTDPPAGISMLDEIPPGESTTDAPGHPAGRRRSYAVTDAADLLALVDGGLSVVEAAARLGMSTSAAYRRVRAARGPAHPERSYIRQTLPVAAWPENLRKNADSLSAPQRQVVGKFLNFAQTRLPGDADAFAPEAVEAFLSWRGKTVNTITVRGDCAALYGAALKLEPDRDWLWLKRETADRRRAAKSEPETARPKRKGGRERILSVAPSEWPAAHRAAFEAAFSPGTPGEFAEFPDDPGPFCHRNPEFRRGLEQSYGLFLGCMRRCGRSDVVTPEAVQSWIDDMRGRNNRPRTIAAYIERFVRVLNIVDPFGPPEWLTLTRDDLISKARYAPKKKDGRHVDPTDLWLIGVALIREARRHRRERETTALMFRNGLIFMLLSSVPVRLANLAMIEIGHHLLLPTHRPGSLRFTAREMKRDRPANYALWPELRAVIDEYNAVYRPVLAGTYKGKKLWICEHGAGPLKGPGLYAAIVTITTRCEKRLGGAVNPHLFRDAVATALIERYPNKPEYAMSLLQHRHPETTREYQEAAQSIYAAIRLSDILTVTRTKLGKAA